jgi:predicted acyltransferase
LADIVSGYRKRLDSLDAFRGATIASMILVNNNGDTKTTFAPLLHADWHGWTFTDLVFPFFLWMVGVAMTFSFARRVEEGADKGRLLLHTLRRAALIFLLGLLLNGFPYYNLETLRIPGVLQRIAVCYLVGAALFLYLTWRGLAAAIVVLCTLYWVLMTLFPVPGYGPGVLEPIGNFAQWVDQSVLAGHMYSRTKVWDPEGIVSTLPAIANVLLGALTGMLLRKQDLAPAERTSWILVSGGTLAFLGAFLDHFLPINKQIWTPSYAVFTSGLAALSFGTFYWLIDVQGIRRWSGWLTIYGMNAIALYTLSGLFSRMLGLTGMRAPLYGMFTAAAPPLLASLGYALFHVAVLFGAAWVMHRRGWYLRF